MISTYHQKYSAKSDEELARRAEAKNQELEQIFTKFKVVIEDKLAKVAVMGCGDKRFIQYHKDFFEKYLAKPVELTTFDITTDHLKEVENVVRHDCTTPLPNSPYDITYAHVLLRFIPTEDQWDVVQNSYTALKPGGLAIHILDPEDYSNESLPDGLYTVNLRNIETKLKLNHIHYEKIYLKSGPSLNLDALGLILKHETS